MRFRTVLGGVAIALGLALPAAAADAVKIGFITKFPVPFFATMENAAKDYAAANPGVEIIYGQGASATDIPGWNGRTALATTDNYAAGKIAGEYLKSVLEAGDTMGILEGVPGVPALDDRVNGMIEGLGGLDVKIVGRGATGCTEEQGISLAEDILTANPDLKSIYAACGPPAAGAAQAIKNANLAGKVLLVGFDFCCGEEEAITAGIENATVAQFPTRMASLGVDALVRAIRGETVGSLIDSGAALVTKANMAEFK